MEGKCRGEVIEDQGEGKEEQKKEERKVGGRCKLQCKNTKRGRGSYLINVVILEGKHGKFNEILNFSI